MPTNLEIDIELSALRKAHDKVAENSQLVMREAETTDCDGEIKTKLLIWSSGFVQKWNPVSAALEELISKFSNYHRIHPSLMRSAVEAEAEKLSKLVMVAMVDLGFQRTLPSDLKRISRALGNIISGCSEINRAAEELRAFVEVETADPYNGMPYPYWEFKCTKCDDTALAMTLIPADAQHPLQNGKPVALLFATRKNSEQEQQSINASKFELLSTCLKKSDFITLRDHSQAALIYCVACKGLYCWDDWSDKSPVYEDGLYDHTEAACPKGHRQQIDD